MTESPLWRVLRERFERVLEEIAVESAQAERAGGSVCPLPQLDGSPLFCTDCTPGERQACGAMAFRVGTSGGWLTAGDDGCEGGPA